MNPFKIVQCETPATEHFTTATRLGIRYSDIIPVTVKTIKEKQEIIISQNERIEKLEAKLKENKDLISHLK